MHAYAQSYWTSFFTAQVAASAALAGLVFVGVSINLRPILESPRLVLRALEPLLLLVSVLVTAVLGLAPGQGRGVLGGELLVLGLVTWAWVGWLLLRSRPSPDETWGGQSPPRIAFVARVVIMQAATVPPILAGATLLAGAGGGLAWTLGGAIAGYVAALFDAWVLLIEIVR